MRNHLNLYKESGSFWKGAGFFVEDVRMECVKEKDAMAHVTV